MFRSVITGTGAYIPGTIKLNSEFDNICFLDNKGEVLTGSSEKIIEKFRQITGIEERRYVPSNMMASDMAAEAGREALLDSNIDPETLDQIIVSHNFGDIADKTVQSQMVPAIANRVKHLLGIQNPGCITYDILFGCPGWVQSVIQTDAYFRADMAKRALLIGTETLSRVIDEHDRDSMIFSDGAGACVMEYRESGDNGPGILGACAQSHSTHETYYIDMGRSYCSTNDETKYIKMKGRKVYEYAISFVPAAMKQCLDKCGVGINEVKKIFIHQANEKMDEEIVNRLYSLYGMSSHPEGIMPMSIRWLGNSSVATIPTLYDMVKRGRLDGHAINSGDIVLFASVGAGMNINAVCYRV